MNEQTTLFPAPEELSRLYRRLGFADEQPDDARLMRRMHEICDAQERLQRDNERLTHYLETLQRDVIRIEESLSWRIGRRVSGLLLRWFKRPEAATPFAPVHRTLTIYHHWKKAR